MPAPQCSNKEFLMHAIPLAITINGQPFSVEPRTYSSGSVGYCKTGKTTVIVNGNTLRFQLAINLVLIGSKPED